MTYIVDPTNIASPSDLDGATQGAEELRALKAYIASLIPGGLGAFNLFRKDALVNSDFQIWQSGTSFPAIANGAYCADNWKWINTSAAVHTVSQSTNVPTIAEAGGKVQYSLLADCTTADATIAAADVVALATFVEGGDFVYIAGVGLCFHFWHGHTKPGTYCVGFRNGAADLSFVREYTQAVSDAWEYALVLVDASPSAGTWDYGTGVGLQVVFTLACGTDRQTTEGAWNSGNFFATANQVNACDDVANNFRLARVQLEKGLVATPHDIRFTAQELENAQRLYWRSIPDGAFPEWAGYGIAGPAFWGQIYFPVTMRITPAVAIRGAWSLSNISSFTAAGASIHGFNIQWTCPGAGGFGITTGSSSDYLEADARF